MNVGIENSAQVTVVLPQGRLDFAASPGFQAELEQAIADGTRQGVIVDCAALDYVSSAGLRAFLVAAKAAQRAGRYFGLCNLKPGVREVFDLSGFSRIMPVHADRVAALAALASAL
jgi:anti-anti-sigma factor